MEIIGLLIAWAISLVIFVFIIGAGVRVGMRWSRNDERKERIARGELVPDPASTYRRGESKFDYRPHHTNRIRNDFK